mmetsp:Transcript_34491/g.89906  ORF Transcript_34491/g.89906 Transcript_34491/m.89906 type:complete len:427 (-) Transcript_34491:1693-2973(-)
MVSGSAFHRIRMVIDAGAAPLSTAARNGDSPAASSSCTDAPPATNIATTTGLAPQRSARCNGGGPVPPVTSAPDSSSPHTSRAALLPAATDSGAGWPAGARFGSAACSSRTRAHWRLPSRTARSSADVRSISAALGLAPWASAACRPANCPLRASMMTSMAIISLTASGSNLRARSIAVTPALSRRPTAAPAFSSSRTTCKLPTVTAETNGEVPASLHWLGSAAVDNKSETKLTGALHRIAATSAGSSTSGSIWTGAPRRMRIFAWSKRPSESAACNGVPAAVTTSTSPPATSCVLTRRYQPPTGSRSALCWTKADTPASVPRTAAQCNAVAPMPVLALTSTFMFKRMDKLPSKSGELLGSLISRCRQDLPKLSTASTVAPKPSSNEIAPTALIWTATTSGQSTSSRLAASTPDRSNTSTASTLSG